ncbi:hypothetical protein BKA67DRAFT_542229 [Truncatella angustata]|uniref:Uncharacterized protein n=1 Tax=Truncatella angustata TaxID=152316 RepID=A0A9P8RF16_9PEZI|nr:uncharacterized protein BKA67DRAFT_542229 [Truncatella angustata]KAH6643266.1 hypothetical protein BKA67DRAFT_542229 [Truncatella angustata]
MANIQGDFSMSTPEILECNIRLCARVTRNLTVTNGMFNPGISNDIELEGVSGKYEADLNKGKVGFCRMLVWAGKYTREALLIPVNLFIASAAAFIGSQMNIQISDLVGMHQRGVLSESLAPQDQSEDIGSKTSIAHSDSFVKKREVSRA